MWQGIVWSKLQTKRKIAAQCKICQTKRYFHTWQEWVKNWAVLANGIAVPASGPFEHTLICSDACSQMLLPRIENGLLYMTTK